MSKLFVMANLSPSQSEDFIYGETVLNYCTNTLNIPYNKIEYVDCNVHGVKIMLQDLNHFDTNQGWYTHLDQVCS